MSEQLMIWATVFLGLFAIVAAVDGLYFHLWKYRLYARAESIYEHKLHTIRAFLFIPIVFFLFYQNSGGIYLWFGVFFVLIDFAVEITDVLIEIRSRTDISGLSPAEYAAHILATILRTAFIALALAAKPVSSWSLSAPLMLEQEYSVAAVAALNIMTGNFLIASLHVWLMRNKYRLTGTLLPLRGGCQR